MAIFSYETLTKYINQFSFGIVILQIYLLNNSINTRVITDIQLQKQQQISGI